MALCQSNGQRAVESVSSSCRIHDLNWLAWHVLGDWSTGDYLLPPAPAAGDRAGGALIAGIRLQGSLDLQDLIRFNDVNLADVWAVTRHFVQAELE